MYSDFSGFSREETLERILNKTISKTTFVFDVGDEDDDADDGGIAFIDDGGVNSKAEGAFDARKKDEEEFEWIEREGEEPASMAATAGDDYVTTDLRGADASSSDSPSKVDLGIARRDSSDVNVNVPAHLLLASLIDEHLRSYSMEASTQRSLYTAVIDNLHRVGVMPKIFGSDEFSPLRYPIIDN